MAKEFYQLIRSFGGLSLEYAAINESDFAATSGAAYTPPERGDFRRITGSRQIQLLSDAPGVIETFETLASGDLFLPANTVADDTNDAGDGRLFFVKNSGIEDLIIKDYLGTSLKTLEADKYVIVVGNDSNNWDIYSFGQDIETQENDITVTDKTTIYNFNSPFEVTDDGSGKVSIDLGTGLGGDGVLTLGFGDSTGDDQYIKAIGGSQTTDRTAPGFPRPVKIIGYFVDSNGKTDKTFTVHLREKTNLPVDKYVITKPATGETIYGWNLNGYTTYAAGERISVYVARGTDKADRPKLMLWYVWND